MERMKRLLLVCMCFAVLVLAGTAHAQILSRGDLFGPGAPPPMIGLNIGLGEHAQQGTFQGNCNCTFNNGTGAGLLGLALFELPLDYEWAAGMMVGLDFKKFSVTSFVNEVGIVEYLRNNQSVVDSTSLIPLQRTGNVKTTYLTFLPYVQYQFYRMGPFIQGGVNVGYLIASDFNQTRDLL